MARGFVSGAIWGTVLSVGTLGALSVLNSTEAERREAMAEAVDAPPAPEQDTAVVVETPEPDQTASDGENQTPPTQEPELVESEAVTEATETAEPTPETITSENADQPAEPADTTEQTTPTEVDTADAPDPGVTSEPGRRPADVTDVTTETDAPALDTPAAGADASPENVAQDPTPAPETGEAVAALTTPETPETPATQPTPSSDAATPTPPSAPTLDAPDSEIGLSVSTEPAQPPVPSLPEVETALVPDPEPDTETQDAPDASEPEASAATTPGEAPERPQVRRLVPDTPAPDATDEGSVDTAVLTRPSIGRPAGSLIERDGESASRLPSVTDGTTPETSETPPVDDSLPPLQRYAAKVDLADPNLPLMSIVLIDDGSGPLGPDTLENFPFPVTFALDPTQSGAAERMRAYRALGYEVATLADLPEGAQPTDVEQILAGAVAALPDSVALIEAPSGALQSSRTTTEQITSFAAESGHGLVFMPNGLNTAEAIARRENVATVSVLRDFDGEGQDARTKRRFLDGAAFRARQDGSAVMLGRLTPDTVSALLLWSLQDRAARVSMVPVSAVLMEQTQ
ncbi:divergent polysaccharide deacetylase family protein [Marivita hallyeonensis]|uniref:Uncharacterized conserved protein YibQ, putative polysaccharide deacetylase 2 family n=1 Tax=Marivita hallyeonensis TaxID=996342 RepID=A0A1M5VST7_9RHOB|nr:divergent polysaccharide deacetylase family protein [Marivita hallyeonensis]SHH78339.1 Uncharacterized conserved protein YibQ, putative polysaccharide deacetylase 2 family [Marivita hallyeonensis]